MAFDGELGFANRIIQFVIRVYLVVETVALDWGAARLFNQADQLRPCQHLLLVALFAVLVGDLVLVDRAI